MHIPTPVKYSAPAPRKGLQMSVVSRKRAVMMAYLVLSPVMGAFAAGTATWNVDPGGSWGTNSNWDTNIVPVSGGAYDQAVISRNIGATTTITLDAPRSIGKLTIGDSNGSHGYVIGAAAETLTFSMAADDAYLTKNNGATDTILADVLFIDAINKVITNAGTLILGGSTTVGDGSAQRLEKSGGATLTFTGNFTLGATSKAFFTSGTTNFQGSTTTLNGMMDVANATLNFGPTTGSGTTTFNMPALEYLKIVGSSTVSFGVNGGASNVNIDAEDILITGGTLNLQNGTGTGTTTIGGSLLTIDGGTVALNKGQGTTTFSNAATLAGVGVLLNGSGTLDFGAPKAGQNWTFKSLNSASTGSRLFSSTGNATLTLGGDSVNDVFDGQINLSGSTSRIIKTGSETLTLGGTSDNSGSRITINEGTVVLAKVSTGGVHAVGTDLIINNTGTALLGGTYAGGGITPAGMANYRDQIYFGMGVTVNVGGVFDLNGFSEGFNTLGGVGTVQNSGAAATLLLGENNGNSTITGTITGALNIWKAGAGNLTFNGSGTNSFTGSTLAARGNLELSSVNSSTHGSLLTTSQITLATSGQLYLNNLASTTGTSGVNRIGNSTGITVTNFGQIIARGSTQTTANGGDYLEDIGSLTVGKGSNLLRIDHANGAVTTNNITLKFDSYIRQQGGVLRITEVSGTTGFVFSSAGAIGNSRVQFDDFATNSLLVGNVSAGTADTKVLIGAFGGQNSSSVNRLVTLDSSGFVRVLDTANATDFGTQITATSTATSSNLSNVGTETRDDNFFASGTTVAGASYYTINIDPTVNNQLTGRVAYNSWVQQNGTVDNNPLTVTIAENNAVHLGDYAGDANALTGGGDLAVSTTGGSGMMLFNNTGGSNRSAAISGGVLDFGSREAIIMANTTVNIYSSIKGTSGLTKVGTSLLSLRGQNNNLSGTITVGDGELRLETNAAIGSSNRVELVSSTADSNSTTAARISLVNGINVGTTPGQVDLEMSFGAALVSENRTNIWNGDILLNPGYATGQANENLSLLRIQQSASLVINGDITGMGSLLGGYDTDPSFNGGQQSRRLMIQQNNAGTEGILKINGAISDVNGVSSLAGQDKLNVFIRGYTGQSTALNNEFNVFIQDATQLSGTFDLRSGYAHIAEGLSSDNTSGISVSLALDAFFGDRQLTLVDIANVQVGSVISGSGIDVGTTVTGISDKVVTISTAVIEDMAAGSGISGGGGGTQIVIRNHDGGNVLRPNSISALLLGAPGVVPSNVKLLAPSIIYGESSGNFSSKSVGIIGGENTSGTVTFGNGQTVLDMTPRSGSSGVSGRTASGVAGFTWTLNDASSLRVGYGVSGANVPAGTMITAISGNVVTFSQATTGAPSGSYNFGFAATGTNVVSGTFVSPIAPVAGNQITLGDVTGLVKGMGISGSGIAADTVITNISGLTVTLSKNTAAAGAGTAYTVYNSANLGLGTYSVALTDTTGLRVGMGISMTGFPQGTVITNIVGNVVTLSTRPTAAYTTGTLVSVALPIVNYNVSVFAASGATTITLNSTEGLVIGTVVNGPGIQNGTTITNIVGNTVELSLPTNANKDANNSSTGYIGFQAPSNYAETRLYQAAGGSSDFAMRFYEEGGYNLNNEVGTLTKVGRGTSILSGSSGGANDLDGGVHVFGGTLVFNYGNNNGGTGASRINGGSTTGTSTNPYQLILAGGELKLTNPGNSVAIVESASGTFTIRPGNSGVTFNAGAFSQISLNLGAANVAYTDASNNVVFKWREPDRFAGGSFQVAYTGTGTGELNYNGVTTAGTNAGAMGIDAIVPYTTVKYFDGAQTMVDIGGFIANPLLTGYGLITQMQNLASGFALSVGVDVSTWNAAFSAGYSGYFSDGSGYNTAGYTGSIVANANGTDFYGVRAIRFMDDTVGTNTIDLGGNRLVLGTGYDPSFVAPTTAYNVRDGGVILVSNTVGASDQAITNGTITSAFQSTYFSTSVSPSPLETRTFAYTSRDLIIHNYNDQGVFTIGAGIVDYTNDGATKIKDRTSVGYAADDDDVIGMLNLVIAGPGTTHLTGANTYTGKTYISGGYTAPINGDPGVYQAGYVWISSDTKLGTAPGGVVADNIYLNGGGLEFANDTTRSAAMIVPVFTINPNRGITLGGNGGYIKTTHVDTVVTYDGIVQSEANILNLNLTETQMQANPGVGDLIKEGDGKFILTNDTVKGAVGWNAYYGLTEVNDGILQVNIDVANSGILGSHDSSIDRSIVRTDGRLDFNISGATFGTSEWLEMNGGTIGTASTHVDGVLDGMITVLAASTFAIDAGSLQLNTNAGFLSGTGNLKKTGVGSLYLYGNNADFSGNWEVNRGALVGRSTGSPFGVGATINLGDNTASSAGQAMLLMQSTLGFTNTYEATQNIIVRTEGGAAQTKYIGAQNMGGSTNSGWNNDRYVYKGTLTLNDDAVLYYADEKNNTHLAPVGSNTDGSNQFGVSRYVAFNGNIASGSGNLSTQVSLTGAGSQTVTATFELNGNNSGWGGGLTMGNASSDTAQQHVVRLGNNNALGSDNSVTMNFNNVLQVGGNNVQMGSLLMGGSTTVNATTEQRFIENASNTAGTLTINQGSDASWNVIIRDGTTPAVYSAATAAVYSNSLSIVKAGSSIATITQANTYTGTTIVSAGTLLANNSTGSATGTGTVTVSSTATLGGTGFIAGNTTVNSGGTLSPGGQTGVGTLSFTGNLSLNSGATSLFTINGAATSDRLVVGGDLSLSTHATTNLVQVSLSGYNPIGGEVWNLIDWTGALNQNSFTVGANRQGGDGGSDLILDNLDLGLVWDVSSFLSNGQISVVMVPEPGRAMLLFMAMMWMIGGRCRRRA